MCTSIHVYECHAYMIMILLDFGTGKNVMWIFMEVVIHKLQKTFNIFCFCFCFRLSFFIENPFVGTYESGIASYKHMYFNATENTMKIWIITVVAIISLYECTKHLIRLMIAKSVRYSMVFLFCLSIFAHYYAWWAYVNYYNDDFYSQWNHQMFFTVNILFFHFIPFNIRTAHF